MAAASATFIHDQLIGDGNKVQQIPAKRRTAKAEGCKKPARTFSM